MKEHISDYGDEDAVKDYLKKLLHKEAFDNAGLIYGMGPVSYTHLAKRLARKAGGKPLGLPCSRTLCFPANPSRFFTREKTAFFFL